MADERRHATPYAVASSDTEDDIFYGEDSGYMAELSTEEGLPTKEKNTNLNQGWSEYGMSDDKENSVGGDGAVSWGETTWGNDWYG